MTEIFINNELIDTDEEEVITATYGNISFGNFATKRGIKTNNFKIPITNRNKNILENAEIFSSYTDTPYSYLPFRVEIDGVEVNKGLVVVNGTSGNHYNLIAIGGISEFYSTISARKLVELDLSEYNHTWNRDSIINSFTNTQGYIYAYAEYGIDTFNNEYMPEYFFPHVFLHTIVKKICEAAGYTIEGKVLSNSRYLKHVIGYSRFPETITFEGPIVLANTLPDTKQSTVMLDFLNCYGLMPHINTVDKVIRFDYIDDIIFNEPIDWSSKLDNSDKPDKDLSIDFYQKSTFTWNTDDTVTDGRKKEVIINDVKITKEGDVYKSTFFVPSDEITGIGQKALGIMSIKESNGYKRLGNYDSSFTFDKGQNVYYNGAYYQALQLNGAGDPKTPGIDVEFWKPVNKKDIVTYTKRIFYGVVEPIIDGSITVKFTGGVEDILWKVKGDLLEWPFIYGKHYILFDSIKNKPKKAKVLVKLNYADINQIDFVKPYILGRTNLDGMAVDDNGFGSNLFVLEEVTQFKLNKTDSTYCTFIQINMEGII